MPFRSGFVSIIGRPNAGKSTLLNALVGEKLAIVTHKPQTTRNRITGIVNVKKVGRRQPGQIVFVDTPGVHKPTDALNKRMMKEVEDALVGCDLLLLMIDVSQRFGTGDEFVLELIKRTEAKAFLILNKIDLIPKGRLLPMIEQYSKLHNFEAVVPISAEKKQGLEELVTLVVNALPEGPKYFPLDQVTDQPERFVVAELIREQVLINTKEEVPYASGVIVERFEDLPKLVKIAAAICVEREGQKGIIIGKQGTMLKHIGTRARLEIERVLGKKVFLELFVKVRQGWRGSARAVEETLDWKRQLEGLTSKTTSE